MNLSFMCNVFAELINLLRSIPIEIKGIIYAVGAVAMILMIRQLVKVNYNKDKKKNFAWLIPIFLILALIVLMSI